MKTEVKRKLSKIELFQLLGGLGLAMAILASNYFIPIPEQKKSPVQAEQQQTKTEVPAIKIVNNQLFVDDKEMSAKDFVEKYCFAKRDNQTCIEASILRNIQQTLQGGEKPKVW